jgi:acyl carrier protein
MPTVSNIEIELNGFKTELSTGEEKIELFIVMDLSREDFSRLKLDSIDPVEAVKKLSRAFKKSGSDKELESIIDRDEILWSTLDNEPVDINTYIRTLYTNRLILK